MGKYLILLFELIHIITTKQVDVFLDLLQL